MRVVQPTDPCYCSECNAERAIRVRFQNKLVVQNEGFALCNRCAGNLASRLVQVLRSRRDAAARSSSTRVEEEA